jgi:hypothetical protein
MGDPVRITQGGLQVVGDVDSSIRTTQAGIVVIGTDNPDAGDGDDEGGDDGGVVLKPPAINLSVALGL